MVSIQWLSSPLTLLFLLIHFPLGLNAPRFPILPESIAKIALTLMGSIFAPGYEITKEMAGSLEEVRRRVAIHLRSSGVANLPPGTAVGFVEKDRFSLHFRKPIRNFWRPEFKGSLLATNDQVKIVVGCGLSKTAEVFTGVYWSLLVLLSLAKLSSGQVSLNDFVTLGLFDLVNIAVPWMAFRSEFAYDRINMKSILDGLDQESTDGG